MKPIAELEIGKSNFKRLLLLDNNDTLDFGFLNDGMIQIDSRFYPLSDFKCYCTITELKNKLEII